MITPTPAALHTCVTELLDAVSAVRKQVDALQYEYVTLRESNLGVDNLGPTVPPAEALAATKLALATVDDALICVVDSIYDAMRHSARLKVRE